MPERVTEGEVQVKKTHVKDDDSVEDHLIPNPPAAAASIKVEGDRNVIILGGAAASVISGDKNVTGDHPPSLAQQKISIARLPITGPDLFGRDAELKLLDDAWGDPSTNIITFVAWGGVGKTALVNADCHLEWARLDLAQGDRDKAREHWATAKAMVERMGYHRRDGEVAEIAQQLGVELQDG